MSSRINKKSLVLLFFFILSAMPLFINFIGSKSQVSKELDVIGPRLSKLNSMEAMAKYVDELYDEKKIDGALDTMVYVELLSTSIKQRFQHGLSNYELAENWIAYLCGKLFWPHFYAIVIPDDILKHKDGLCSQQTIVFMDLLRRKGIGMRSVGLGYPEGPGHFLCEVNYKGRWHLYDVSLEPTWSVIANKHQSLDYYMQNKDSLFLAYQTKISRNTFDKLTEKVVFGKPNKFPAEKMKLFHKSTLIISYMLPLLFGFLFGRSVYKERKTETYTTG